MKQYSILNLGAGVQSTTVYLLNLEGKISPRYDFAIFADTQEEPVAVYEHLKWLESLGGPPILRGTAGRLGDDLVRRGDGRAASIPAFTGGVGKEGMLRRQCTKEYKLEVIDRVLRRRVLGLKPRGRIPAGVHIEDTFGISFDERGRASRIYERFLLGSKNRSCRFPLIEMKWSRVDCRNAHGLVNFHRPLPTSGIGVSHSHPLLVIVKRTEHTRRTRHPVRHSPIEKLPAINPRPLHFDQRKPTRPVFGAQQKPFVYS